MLFVCARHESRRQPGNIRAAVLGLLLFAPAAARYVLHILLHAHVSVCVCWLLWALVHFSGTRLIS